MPRVAFQAYDAAYSRSPMIVSGLTMGFKAGLCDIVAQKIAKANAHDPSTAAPRPSDHQPKPNNSDSPTSSLSFQGGDHSANALEGSLDFSRVLKFMSFNVFYEGSFQHVLYNVLYPRLFPVVGSSSLFSVALKMSVFDNLVHTPFLYLPAYYAFKSVVVDETHALEGLREYYREGLVVLVACWTVWVPAQVLIFWKVPPNFRIATTAAFGTLWDVILSYMAPMARPKEELRLIQVRQAGEAEAEASKNKNDDKTTSTTAWTMPANNPNKTIDVDAATKP